MKFLTPCALLLLGLATGARAEPSALPDAASSLPSSAPATMDGEDPAAAVDDPFFSGDLDHAFDDVDTEWKDDQEVATETRTFVGPPSPLAAYRALVKHDAISLLLKTRILASVQEVPDTRSDGFQIRQLRAVVSGKLGHGFDYYTQIDAASSRPLIDAIIGWGPIDALKLSLGQMKTPFSGEFLISRPDLSFIERSEAQLAISANRSVGAQLSGHFLDQHLSYRAGVFNGEGFDALEWGRSLLYVGRVQAVPLDLHLRSQNFQWTVAINAAYGPRAILELGDIRPLSLAGTLDGSRLLAGADSRLQLGPVWLAGEWLYGLYDGHSSTRGTTSFFATGGYGEAGMSLVPGTVDIMVRYDALYASVSEVYTQFILFGVRVFATDFLRIQLNYAWGPGYGTSSYWSPNQLQAAFQLLL
ncbi:MAG: porin [Pseudomonadota bacterium]